MPLTPFDLNYLNIVCLFSELLDESSIHVKTDDFFRGKEQSQV